MGKRPIKKRIIVEPKEEATFANAQGLGDTIEAFTTVTGIKKGVELLSKALDWDCGCDERKEKLNALWSYRKLYSISLVISTLFTFLECKSIVRLLSV